MCRIATGQKPELVVQSGHSGKVIGLAFSPDGKLLASGADDNTVKLWDASSGKELHTLSGMRGWSHVAFSPDGLILATGGAQDGVLRLWDVATSKLLVPVPTVSGIHDVAFSPDGKLLATANSGAIYLWRVPSGGYLDRLEGHIRSFDNIVFSRDGKLLFSTSPDKTIRAWDVDGRRLIRAVDTKSSPDFGGPDRLFLGPDDKTIFTNSYQEGLTAWDLETGAGRSAHEGHIGKFPCGVSPDGRVIAWCDWARPDPIVTLLELSSNSVISTLPHYSGGFGLFVFSRDGRTIASGSERDGTVKLWDVATGQELRTITGHAERVNSIAFSPDGVLLARAASSDHDIKIWNLSKRTEIATLKGHTEEVHSVAFSFDGKLLASGGYDDTARVWDVSSGGQLAAFTYYEGQTQPGISVSLSPDGKTLATGSEWDAFAYEGIRFWDVPTGHEIHPPGVPKGLEAKAVAFTADGRLVTTRRWNVPSMWDLKAGVQVPMPAADSKDRSDKLWALSRDGTRLVSQGFSSSAIDVLDLTSGNPPRIIAQHSPDAARILKGITALALSPDNRTVAVADGKGVIQLIDVDKGTGLKLGPTSDSIELLVFHPDGKILASAGHGPRIRLWDVNAGRELLSLFSFPDGSWAVVDAEGRYDASDGGRVEWLHWVAGDEAIGLNQLKERYYEPGLLAKVIGFNKEPVHEVTAFNSVALYPEASVTAGHGNDCKFDIHLSDRGGGIGRVAVWLNGKEVATDARGDLLRSRKGTLDLQLDVSKSPFLKAGQKNTVELRAFNSEGYLASRNVQAVCNAPGEAPLLRPSFWGIVTGISEYAGPGIRLQYAGKDAADMAKALRVAAERLVGPDHTHITLLTTAQAPGAILPTRDNLRIAFEGARQAKPGDILVVYLAGHGVNYGGPEGDYYYLTQEARTGDLTDPAVREQTAVSSLQLTDWIKQIPALKQTLLLDTCGAGLVVQKLSEKRDVSSSQIRSFERMKDRMGLYILAGSAADAVSDEASQYAQGLLTYSLLLGMRGAALREDHFVDVSKWFEFAADEVPRLAKDIGGIQRPVPAVPGGGASFDVGEVLSEDKALIPLAAVRPVFLQSSFQDEVQLRDHLKLTALINEELRGTSARGQEGNLVYVDAADFPDGYSVSGLYRVEGSNVAVRIALFKGEKQVNTFTLKGEMNGLDKLAHEIISRAVVLSEGSR